MMLERLGMRREACFVHATYFDGNWHNQYAYAILKAEWAQSSSTEKTILSSNLSGESLPSANKPGSE